MPYVLIYANCLSLAITALSIFRNVTIVNIKNPGRPECETGISGQKPGHGKLTGLKFTNNDDPNYYFID